MTNMNVFMIILWVSYFITAMCSWPIFVYWLHDTKKEIKNSWMAAILIGLPIAMFWPVSLIMLYFDEKDNSNAI